MKSPADYFKPPIQSTGLQILIIERQCKNVFIKIDRIPEAFFRLFHAARNARITGKVENDHGRAAAHFELAMRSKTPKRTSLESFAGGPMKPDRDSGGTRPALALCPGKSEAQGMKTARSTCISRIWRPCEPMVSSRSKARRTSFGLRLSTSRSM